MVELGRCCLVSVTVWEGLAHLERLFYRLSSGYKSKGRCLVAA